MRHCVESGWFALTCVRQSWSFAQGFCTTLCRTRWWLSQRHFHLQKIKTKVTIEVATSILCAIMNYFWNNLLVFHNCVTNDLCQSGASWASLQVYISRTSLVQADGEQTIFVDIFTMQEVAVDHMWEGWVGKLHYTTVSCACNRSTTLAKLYIL